MAAPSPRSSNPPPQADEPAPAALSSPETQTGDNVQPAKEKAHAGSNTALSPPKDDAKQNASNDGQTPGNSWLEERTTKLVAGWKFMDFHEFKNRLGPDQGLEIIEVLHGYHLLEVDMWSEMNDRARPFEDGRPMKMPHLKKEGPDYAQCIRIQSPHLLMLLPHVLGLQENWSTGHTPRVFFRPFRAQYYSLSRMKEVLLLLEHRVAALFASPEGGAEVEKTNIELNDENPSTEAKDVEGVKSKDDNRIEVRDGSAEAKHPEGVKSKDDNRNQLRDETAEAKDGEIVKVTSDDDAQMKDNESLSGTATDSESNSDRSSVWNWVDEVTKGDIIRVTQTYTPADTRTMLEHVRTYVDFVERHVVPIWNQAALTPKHKGTWARHRVTWYDLWASFKIGEIVYCKPPGIPANRNGLPHRSHGDHQSLWRVFNMARDPFTYEELVSGGESFRDDLKLHLHCYHINYDGISYQPVTRIFPISYYEGERDITNSWVYPLRYAMNSEQVMKEFLDQGNLFQRYTSNRHLYYDGWTTPHRQRNPDPRGGPPIMTNSEHIDSTIMIDFGEGYAQDSTFTTPNFMGIGDYYFDYETTWPNSSDDLEIRYRLCGKCPPKVYCEHVIKDVAQRSELFADTLRSRYSNDFPGHFIHDWNDNRVVTELKGDDLVLLPSSVVAFAFRERKFILVNTAGLREIRAQEDIWKNLRIPRGHKEMILSVVAAHFEKQAIQKSVGSLNLGQDLIRGKGAGLFMLLHGVPGVGKTATAEAIAQVYEKPLFVITCGDLGFEPGQVDATLRNIFRLAHLWDCVLLLDEADVFLSRREIYDLKRNALVSVFLRVLEYYSGILFLTTNRVGHLDEAFKSRIHVSLYYPPLSKQQTLAIFHVNIRQLSKIEDEKQELMHRESSGVDKRPKMEIDTKGLIDFAAEHWESRHDQPSERWNGRQIRNAFQIAYSLAQRLHEKSYAGRRHGSLPPPAPQLTATAKGKTPKPAGPAPAPFPAPATPRDHPDPAPQSTATEDKDKMAESSEATQAPAKPNDPPPKPLTLNASHFEEIARIIKRFDAYLYDTLAGTAADSALTAGTRADAHRAEEDYYGPPPPQEYMHPHQAQQFRRQWHEPQQQAPTAFTRRRQPQQGGGAGPSSGSRGPPARQPQGRGTGDPPPPRRQQRGGAPAQRGAVQQRPAGSQGGRRGLPAPVPVDDWDDNDELEEQHRGWGLEPQGRTRSNGVSSADPGVRDSVEFDDDEDLDDYHGQGGYKGGYDQDEQGGDSYDEYDE